MERERQPDEVRIKVDRPRCPYCHDDVTREQDVAVCRDCDAKHHGECWPVEGRCGACGGVTALRAAPPPTPSVSASTSPSSVVVRVRPVELQGSLSVEEGGDPDGAGRDLSVARWAFADTLNVLERTREQVPYPWWSLLVPLCWPLVYLRYRARRARVRELVEHARYIARRHALDISEDDEATLRAATIWAY